jgi:hypothetical protein
VFFAAASSFRIPSTDFGIIRTGMFRPSHLCLCLVAAGLAAAQVRIDPTTPDGGKLTANFDTQWKLPPTHPLKCELTRLAPALDYGLHLWAGYSATVSAAELGRQPEERAATLFRVTPTKAPDRAAYFYQNVNIPRRPAGVDPRKATLTVGGGFLLGPGRYRVDWLLLHSDGRSCRQSWSLSVKGKGTPMSPSQIESVDASLWRGFPPDSGDDPKRKATIVLHASPVWPRRYLSRLSPWDRQILLSTLGSVPRDGGFHSASVVVDLERRRVLLREPNFDPRAMRRLARLLYQVDYSTISMDTLAFSPSPRPFLEETLRIELTEPTPSDAFIFIGSRYRGGPKPNGLAPDVREALPKSWLLAFSTPQTAAEADSFSSLVKAARGRVVSIYSPADLAAALRDLAVNR